MNFLQMVQKLHVEVGAAGRAPVAVTSQTGEAARLVGWIQQANMDVQNLWENWKFLRETYSQATTSTVNTLAKPADFGSGMWDFDTFFVTEEGDTTQQPLIAQEYSEVKSEIIDTSPGVPWRAVVMPDSSLRLEGTPDGAHTIYADYFREPDSTELVANDSVSSIPARFHLAVIGRAIVLYGNYENAPEFKTQGSELYSDYLGRLENSQLDNQKHSRYRTGAKIEIRNE